MLQHSGRYQRCVFCKEKRFGLQKCLRFQNEYNTVEIGLRVVQFWIKIKLVIIEIALPLRGRAIL
jgi:hypothetical protein